MSTEYIRKICEEFKSINFEIEFTPGNPLSYSHAGHTLSILDGQYFSRLNFQSFPQNCGSCIMTGQGHKLNNKCIRIFDEIAKKVAMIFDVGAIITVQGNDEGVKALCEAGFKVIGKYPNPVHYGHPQHILMYVINYKEVSK